MNCFDKEYIDKKTEDMESKARKDKSFLKNYMESAIKQSKGVAREEEFLFAYCIARSELLWMQLTQLDQDEAFFSALGKNFSFLKKIPGLKWIIGKSDQKSAEQKELNDAWREVLEKSSPLFAYKLKEENVKVSRAYGKTFDDFFCNSVISHYKRWRDELLAYSHEDGLNYFIGDLHLIFSALANEKQIEKVLALDASLFYTVSQNSRWNDGPLSLFLGPVLKHPKKLSPCLRGHPVIPRIIDEYPPNATEERVSLLGLELTTGVFTDLFGETEEGFVHFDMLCGLTSKQLSRLFSVNSDQLQARVLDFVLSQLDEGDEKTLTLIDFFGITDASIEESIFEILDAYRISEDLAKQARYQKFVDNLSMLASKDGFVENFDRFLSKVFNRHNVFLIKAVFLGLAKNYDEFSELVSKPYCGTYHIANSIDVPETMEAFAKHKLPLEEMMVGVILRAFAEGKLLMVVADETIEIYVNSLSAYVNKTFTKLEVPEARFLISSLFSRDITRERFFPGLTRAQFVKFINACNDDDKSENAYRLSATFFKVLDSSENGRHRTLSSVLKVCVRQISNPVFYLELFKHPKHCEAVFKSVKARQFCERFNDARFDRYDIAEVVAPYAKKIIGEDDVEELLSQNYSLRCALSNVKLDSHARSEL